MPVGLFGASGQVDDCHGHTFAIVAGDGLTLRFSHLGSLIC